MTTHVQTLLAILLSAAALAGIIWRRLDPVVKITKYLHGEDGDEKRGVPGRPGILERQTVTEKNVASQAAELQDVRQMVEEIRAAVRNNGGSSLLDKVEKTLALAEQRPG